jgi:hypothetical protein
MNKYEYLPLIGSIQGSEVNMNEWLGLTYMNVKTMINECVGAMSLAIHEGMDSRGFHLETGKAP